MTWTHDGLADDLAAHVGAHCMGDRMVWKNLPMGPGSSQRPDVFAMMKSFTNPKPTVYEVKVSRSDFLADVTAGKWMGYRAFASAIYFAMPDGLVKRTEIPDGCGLMFRSETGWRYARKPTLQPNVPDFEAMMRLLIRATEGAERVRKGVAQSVYAYEKTLRKKIGEDAACYIRNSDNAREALEAQKAKLGNLKAQAEELVKQAEERGRQRLYWERQGFDLAVKDCAAVLGLPPETAAREVVEKMQALADTGGGIKGKARRALERAMHDAESIVSKLKDVLGDDPGAKE